MVTPSNLCCPFIVKFKEKGGGGHGYGWMPVWLTAEEIIQYGSIYNVLL
jgi:hypothetical protein